MLALRERHEMPLENFRRENGGYCFSTKRLLQVVSDGTGSQSGSSVRKVEGEESPDESSNSEFCNVCCMES